MDPTPDPPAIVPGLVYPGGLVMLVGAPSAGKTWLAIHLAAAIVAGSAVLGQSCATQAKVLLVEAEGRRDKLKGRLRAVGLEVSTPGAQLLSVLHRQAVRLDDPLSFERLRGEVAEIAPAVIIIDPLADHHLADENDGVAMREILARISELRAMPSTPALILSHHSAKSEWNKRRPSLSGARGSSVLQGAADLILAVTSPPDRSEGVVKFTVEPVKDREGDAPMWPIDARCEVSRAEWRWSKLIGEPAARRRRVAEIPLDQQIISALRTEQCPVTRDDLRAQLRAGATRFRCVLDELIAKGVVAASRRGVELPRARPDGSEGRPPNVIPFPPPPTVEPS